MLNKIEIDSVIRGGLWKAAFLHNPNFWHNQNPMDCYLEMGFLLWNPIRDLNCIVSEIEQAVMES